MIISGDRKLNGKTLSKLLPHLFLTSAEKSHLHLICSLSNAKSQDEKSRAMDSIQKHRSYQKTNPKETEVYQYLTHWYYVVIREMTALPEFELKAEWIQKRLMNSVTLADINRAIEFLTLHQFLSIDSEGKVRPPERRLECVEEIHKIALAKYYKQIFSLAMEHIAHLEPSQKYLSGHMVALSHENFIKIKNILDETLKDIEQISESEKKPESVYQFSLLGFKITKQGA